MYVARVMIRMIPSLRSAPLDRPPYLLRAQHNHRQFRVRLPPAESSADICGDDPGKIFSPAR